MARPALVKLGGSLLTDKSGDMSFRRAPARRLLSEIAKADVQCVLLHGAGSFGHPQASRHRIGQSRAKPDGVSEVLAAAGWLHAQMVQLAHEAGLKPISIPLHFSAQSDGDSLIDIPAVAVARLVEEGYTPMLHGTLVRDPRLGWRIVSADELMQELAAPLQPRLAVFTTDVDGVYDGDPRSGKAVLLEKVKPGQVQDTGSGTGSDVTGRMTGKLDQAFAVARSCPTIILNGEVRGRLLDALKGKPVVGTRVQA